MLFRKNKERKHICAWCGFSDLNFYYGIKSYNDIPIYDFNYYMLRKDRCKYCGTEFYYLIEKEEATNEMYKL